MAEGIVNYERLKSDITLAAVRAINGLLFSGEEKALRDVPVRKIFAGGRQGIRFKTAEEIERDAPLRARLGLAPEILATPAAISAVRAQGRNPIKARRYQGKEFGFARTIEFPSRSRSVDQTGRTPAERGRTRISSNKENPFLPNGQDTRILKSTNAFGYHVPIDDRRTLADEDAGSTLTSRGRYEVKSGRAISQRTKKITVITPASRQTIVETGKVTESHVVEEPVGPARVGGGLRNTIRVEQASPSQYPNLEGWLIAGDREHDYAIHQELGNRHNPAHPFLRPRLPEWREALPVALKRSLRRTGR